MNEKELLLQGWLKCHAVIELMGKPKEHIDDALKKYIEQIKQEKNLQVSDVVISEAQRMNTGATKEGMMQEVWTAFADVDFMINDPVTLTAFCLQYMPASIEIIEPAEMKLTSNQTTTFFNDLQSRLHQLDMAAKKVKTEVIFLRKSINKLLTNYVRVLLGNRSLDADQLSTMIGMNKEALEDFLDNLIDNGKITMEGDLYKVKHEN